MEQFLSEIRIFSFNFPPKGWALCNGQLLPINQNQALFALLGTTYGGNGQTNFALPNLRGRTPIHFGNGHTLGEAAGQTSQTVTIQQLPAHIHPISQTLQVPVGTTANTSNPVGNYVAANTALPQRFSNNADEVMLKQDFNTMIPQDATNTNPVQPVSLSNVGGSQPHNNMMPYLVLNFCIALQGIFPSRN